MEKLTDSHGRKLTYLRISITDRCNFRCRYCMPPEGIKWIPHDRIMSFEDIEFLVSALLPMGIRKVRFTGGEPFVRRGFVPFLKDIRELHNKLEVTVTTNGTMLKPYTEDLQSSGVSGINISLDTLDREKFRFVTRSDGYDDVINGIRTLAEETSIPLKINTVLIRKFNDMEVESLIRFARKNRAVIRFIEFMPLDEEVWTKESFISSDEIFENMPGGPGQWMASTQASNNASGGPAKYYKNRETGQKIGIIAAVTNHFCNSCNRLRVTATGQLRTCLFAKEGVELLPALRRRDEHGLQKLIREAAFLKPESWTILDNSERHMSQIGG